MAETWESVYVKTWLEIADFEEREQKSRKNHKAMVLLKYLKSYANLVNDARFAARMEAYVKLSEKMADAQACKIAR